MFGITARASTLQLFVTVMSTRRKCHFIMQNYKSTLCNKAKYVGSVPVWTSVEIIPQLPEHHRKWFEIMEELGAWTLQH